MKYQTHVFIEKIKREIHLRQNTTLKGDQKNVKRDQHFSFAPEIASLEPRSTSTSTWDRCLDVASLEPATS